MGANEVPEGDRAGDLREDRGEPERLAFLLLPEFPIYALILAVEALRIANQNSGRRLYEWQLLSVDGGPVQAGNGMSLSVDNGLAEMLWVPTVFVCAGNHPLQHVNRRGAGLAGTVGTAWRGAGSDRHRRLCACPRRAAWRATG